MSFSYYKHFLSEYLDILRVEAFCKTVGFIFWFWLSIVLNDRQPQFSLYCCLSYNFPSHLVFSTSSINIFILLIISFFFRTFSCCRNLLDFLFLITYNSSKHFHVVPIRLVKLPLICTKNLKFYKWKTHLYKFQHLNFHFPFFFLLISVSYIYIVNSYIHIHMFDFIESQSIEEAIVVEILYFDIYKKSILRNSISNIVQVFEMTDLH